MQKKLKIKNDEDGTLKTLSKQEEKRKEKKIMPELNNEIMTTRFFCSLLFCQLFICCIHFHFIRAVVVFVCLYHIQERYLLKAFRVFGFFFLIMILLSLLLLFLLLLL